MTCEKHKWHKIPEEKPTEEVQYLCCTMYGGKPYFKVMNWSNNLFKIDIYDFYDCKGKSGFYEHDSEYGYLEGYCDFWKPIEWDDEDDDYTWNYAKLAEQEESDE